MGTADTDRGNVHASLTDSIGVVHSWRRAGRDAFFGDGHSVGHGGWKGTRGDHRGDYSGQ